MRVDKEWVPMGRVNWMSIVATLGMVGTVILLVLGQSDEAVVGGLLVIAAAILAHLK
jgi:hypothetical protein